MKKSIKILALAFPNFLSLLMLFGYLGLSLAPDMPYWLTELIYLAALLVALSAGMLIYKSRSPRPWIVGSWLVLFIVFPAFEKFIGSLHRQ